jgi:nitroimidazol reductase NimA-like FMN-containing flavoprotein (pyridoxamine 5'-phosphate oxidase superfamily)
VDERIRRALSRGHLIDITTTGRTTGRPRRIEIVFHVIDGRIYISGMPSSRKRAWLANLERDPITDETERRAVLEQVARNWRRTDVERMVAQSPLVEVTFPSSSASSPGA